MTGFSGSGLRRRTAEDGTPLVIKRIAPDDFVHRAIGGTDRLAVLWHAGVLARLPDGVSSAMISVDPDGDGWLVTMRDVERWLLPSERRVSRRDCSRILAGLRAMHDRFAGADLPPGLCPLATWVTCLSPPLIAPYVGESPLAAGVADRWRTFSRDAPRDVVDVVRAVHADPQPLAEALGRQPATLVHGDVWRGNLALSPDGLVLLDWGVLTTRGPGELDVWQWWIHEGPVLEPGLDALERAAGLDGEASELAVLAVMSQMAWLAAAEPLAGWWFDRTRLAVKRLGWP